MPPRHHESSPTFDSQPRSLRPYIRELTHLFETYGIVSDTEKKFYATRYLDDDPYDLWESIDQFRNSSTFEEFVLAVYALYPGSNGDNKWSIHDLQKLVLVQASLEIERVEDLGTYYRRFLPISQFLRSRDRISHAEQNRAFVRGMQPKLWCQVLSRLEIIFPDHDPDDSYALSDIYNAALYVLGDPLPSSHSTFASTHSPDLVPPLSCTLTAPSTLVPTPEVPSKSFEHCPTTFDDHSTISEHVSQPSLVLSSSHIPIPPSISPSTQQDSSR